MKCNSSSCCQTNIVYDEGKYWNQQGIEYLRGVNKPLSVDDSERCFRKAINCNCDLAEYNLYVLMRSQIIDNKNDELVVLKQRLKKKGLLDSIDHELEILGKTALLRLKLEEKLEGLKDKVQPQKDMCDYINVAYSSGLISDVEKDIYHAIRLFGNGNLHVDKKTGQIEIKEIPESKLELWCNVLSIDVSALSN